MSQKINPLALRLGIIRDWKSQWFSDMDVYRKNLQQDYVIRSYLQKKIDRQALEEILINRFAHEIKITILSPRPGFIVGRGGSGVESLKNGLDIVLNGGKSKKDRARIKLDVEEVRHPESHAALVAQNIALDLEKRMPYRRVVKQAMEKTMQNKEVQGIKVQVAGRLGGAEISRREWLLKGKISLHTIRADIDYAHRGAYTTYGVIGVKVWIYKGEIFSAKQAIAEARDVKRKK